jgi:hypothetical protein
VFKHTSTLEVDEFFFFLHLQHDMRMKCICIFQLLHTNVLLASTNLDNLIFQKKFTYNFEKPT